MPKNNLSVESSDLNLPETVNLNGVEVRMGIDEHFNRYELQAYAKRKFQYNFSHRSLDYYTDHINLSRVEKSYSYALAFHGRIDLPLELTFSSFVSYQHYPVDGLYNFTLLNQLFEKYYNSFQKLEVDNDRKKNTFKHQLVQVVFKFWLSGYGLLPNCSSKTIGDEELLYLRNWEKTSRTKVARFLGYILSNEKESPVTKIPRMFLNTPLETREEAKWKTLLERAASEITYALHSFVFGNLKDRINKSSIIEYEDIDGQLIRESVNSLTDGTWVAYSTALLDLSDYLFTNNIFSIHESLDNGILKVMTDIVSTLPENSKVNIRIACRHWLYWYTKTNKIKLNISRIVPTSFKNKGQSFGRMINYGTAQTLIQVLLDEDCGYFDESNIMDFRSRRACLLELATAQRASEICNLLYRSLQTDNQGVTWLIFHKTKFSKSNKVVATPDIIKWVHELQSVAPQRKILISTSEYPYGDNLEEYRLLANQFDEGPYTSAAMQDFLDKIQYKIWGEKKSDRDYFTTHDLRRIHAIYMRINEYTLDEIKDQLGHENITSSLPYLATKPIEHQKWFKKIQLEGVYQNVDSQQEDSPLDINIAMANSSDSNLDNNFEISLVNKLLEISNDVKNFEIPEPPSIPLPTGFPMRLFNCNANLMVNCGHTELHCFKCNFYKPDSDTLEDHKVELFRFMVLVQYQKKLIKNTKDIVQNHIVQIRTEDISELLKQAFNKLLMKFNLSEVEIQEIEDKLSKKSKVYISKFFNTNPHPSFQEATVYLNGGYEIG